MKEVVGRNIRELRLARGWTQLELAEHSKVSRSFISQIESGDREPTASILKRIADALGVSVDDLFVGSDYIPLISLLSSVPPDVAEFLLSQEAVAYIKLMADAKRDGIPETLIREVIDLARRTMKMSKSGGN